MNILNFHKNNFSKEEIADILINSKKHNVKFLSEVLSIKKIYLFDASYIMNKLDLTSEKIKLINLTLAKFEKITNSDTTETESDFLFRIVKTIENLENNHSQIFNESFYTKDNSNMNTLIDYLYTKSTINFEPKTQYVFSTIYN